MGRREASFLFPPDELILENVSTVVRLPTFHRSQAKQPSAPATQISAKDAASLMLRISVSCTTAIASSLGTYGLTYLEWRILTKIAAADGITIGALAQAIGRSAPQTNNAVYRLEGKGWLSYQADVRPGVCYVTEKTWSVLPYPEVLVDRLVERMNATLPSSFHISQLHALMEQFIQA